MRIEFRQIIQALVSHKIKNAALLDFNVILTFEHLPGHQGPAFVFDGKQVLKKCGLPETESFKGYFIGVEKEGELTKLHILENHQHVLTVNRNTCFQLQDLVLIET